jgi:hypothetical protein
MNALRYLDLFVVVVTAPVVVLLGAPALGTLVGAAAWILQRLAALAVQSRARREENVRAAIGLNLAGAFGRAWLVALTILAVGLAGSREDGLAAAILTLAAYTIYFATTLAVRTLEKDSAHS